MTSGVFFVLIISLYLKNDFQENTPNIRLLMFRLTQSSHFGLWDIPNTRAKGLVGARGNDVLKIFFLFPICIIQKVAILAPK